MCRVAIGLAMLWAFFVAPARSEVVKDVLAREGEPGDKRLVAYIVAAAEQLPTVSELRSFLLKKLPDYMVPSLFMI